MFPICMVTVIVCLTYMSNCNCPVKYHCTTTVWTFWNYVMLLSQVIIHCCQSKRHHGFSMYVCEWLLCCSLLPSNQCVFYTSSPPFMFWFGPQGSESESVNGPGRDSGLASSRLEPSATLPSRGGAESEPETMEGMLCRKQEMESHSKKAATRSVFAVI